MIFLDNYLTNYRTIVPNNERKIKRGAFLDCILSRVGFNDKIFVLVSPSYDLRECSRDLGNELFSRHKDGRVIVSRSPRIHPDSLRKDVDKLYEKACDSSVVVYLAHHFCDTYEHSLPTGRHRYGHHIVEAVGVVRNLKKPLVVGHLDNCTHSHDEDIKRFSHYGLEVNVFHVGSSNGII